MNSKKDEIKKEYDMINDNLQSIIDLVVVSEHITDGQAESIFYDVQGLEKEIRKVYSSTIKNFKVINQEPVEKSENGEKSLDDILKSKRRKFTCT